LSAHLRQALVPFLLGSWPVESFSSAPVCMLAGIAISAGLSKIIQRLLVLEDDERRWIVGFAGPTREFASKNRVSLFNASTSVN
jgi:hypothetical protein